MIHDLPGRRGGPRGAWRRDPLARLRTFLRGRLQPARNDPRHNDPSVLPGQSDVPAGGTSGSELRGVGGRRKR
jgi:hypothetical protein